VSRAIVGARSTLAGRAIVSFKALASTGATVADALVGTLHVSVSGVVNDIIVRVAELGELLVGTLRVDSRSNNGSGGISITDNIVVVQISLGGINMSQVEGASALGAIRCLPVAVAGAHIKLGTSSVSRACVGALSGSISYQGGAY
jgi:hypothetical protein